MSKELQSSASPLKTQKKNESLDVSKKIELCQQFTVTKNLKEIYDTVK